MTNSDGQLYTIEGFAAALIMVITAFLVLNATSVYTAGDTHINDMQLEAIGTDALNVMGTPINNTESINGDSTLRTIIEEPDSAIKSQMFRTTFLELVNVNGTSPKQDIQFVATYTCRDISTSEMRSNPISYSRNLTGGEHTVRATKWVIADTTSVISDACNRNNQAVLVEVLLWRD
jgi:hypothetical protein